MLVGVVLGTMQCGLSPLCGGGTETGNPGMLECAHAVFAEVDSAGWWSLAGYLPGGEQQLDPDCLLTQKPMAPLGKCRIFPGYADTSEGFQCHDNYCRRYDTVTVIDTLYNNATVVKNAPVFDTVFPAAPAAESSMVIVERIIPDTIKTIDTVVNSNIQVVPLRDTAYFPLTDSATVFKVYN